MLATWFDAWSCLASLEIASLEVSPGVACHSQLEPPLSLVVSLATPLDFAVDHDVGLLQLPSLMMMQLEM